MSISSFKVLWFLLSWMSNLLEAIYYFGLEFRENFFHFIKTICLTESAVDCSDVRPRIDAHIREMKKLPKHLAVILTVKNKKDVDLAQLSNLVRWALNSGVHFISFYDFKGVLKHELASSFHKLIQQQDVKGNESEHIVWGPDYQSSLDRGIMYPHRNGYQKHIVVNLYSSEDGQVKFSKLLTQELCSEGFVEEKCDSKNITIDYIDDKLQKLYGGVPDPELAIYFGSACCTAGFLPWQIRLTEFFPISFKIRSLSLDHYIRVLYKYAKCEQRLGK